MSSLEPLLETVTVSVLRTPDGLWAWLSLDESRLERVPLERPELEAEAVPTGEAAALRAYLLERYGVAPDEPLPGAFVENLLWAARGAPWEQVQGLLRVYHRLHLEGNRPALALLARLLHYCPVGSVLSWLEASPRDPASYLAGLLEAVPLPPGPPRPLLSRLSTQPRCRVCYFAEGVRAGLDPEFMLAGFELAGDKAGPFEVAAARPEAARVKDLLAALPEEAGLPLWHSLSALPGLDRALGQLDLSLPDLDPVRAVRLFADAVFHPEHWPELRERAAFVAQLLRAVPFRDKAVRLLGALAWKGLLKPAQLRLAERLSGAPFEPGTDVSEALSVLLELAPAQALAAAPDPCFRQLEQALRRPGRARRLCRGLRVLRDQFPQLALQWFIEFPHPMLRMAGGLGDLPPDRAQEVARRCRSHLLFDPGLFRSELEEAAGRLGAWDGVPRTLPQPLQDYLAAGRPIPESARSRLRTSLERRTRLSQIELLRAAAGAAARELATAPPRLEGDRRALGAFLQACWRGEEEEARATRLECLRRGVRLERGAVKLRPALGPWETAAVARRVAGFPLAAALLEGDKHVVVARTPGGRYLAGALLGLTEAGRLTFLVEAADHRPLFEEYAATLAHELGIR